jgi:putative spermidine/putrescine transport system substrate-binding protein
VNRVRTSIAALAATGLILTAAGCAPPAAKPAASSSAGASTATSAADVGGMDALVTAAQKEGALNVIALPPDWANYGKIIEGFTAKYNIKINSAQPDAASQEEINAAQQLKGSDRAPDVFDLGQSVALANTDLFAPYKVAAFDSIDASFKDANGT